MSFTEAVYRTLTLGDDEDDEPDAEGDGPVVPATVDEAAGMLSTRRRRWLIEHLADVEETTLSKASDAFSAEEYDGSYSSQERKRTYVALYQTHIGKMHEAGVIHYEDDHGQHTIRKGPHFEGYLELVETLDEMCLSGEESPKTEPAGGTAVGGESGA